MNIRGVLAAVLVVFILSVNSFAEMKYGLLKVFGGNNEAVVYIDGGRAGKNIVTIEEISAGTHYIKVLLHGETVYDKTVLVSEGQQTTVVVDGADKRNEEAQSNNDKQKLKRIKGVSLLSQITYGTYDLTLSSGGSSGTYTFRQTPIGIGVGMTGIIADYNYYSVVFNYNLKAEDTQLSYLSLNLGGRSNNVIGELGLNYPLWQVNGLSVTGNIGYQATIGMMLNDYLTLGLGYIVYNGSFTYSGYPYTIRISQLMFYLRGIIG